MAIGSEGELGVRFGRWGDMTPKEQELWSSTFRERFGDDLMKGYATVAYPKRLPQLAEVIDITRKDHQQ